jgi:hypothetical protein
MQDSKPTTDDVQSALVTDLPNRHPRNPRRYRVAEGVHEWRDREVHTDFELVTDGRGTGRLEQTTRCYVDGEQVDGPVTVDWSAEFQPIYDGGHIEVNGRQPLGEFVEDAFHADPVVSVTDGFEGVDR